MLEGDSGAWIVHAAASELYGHVVATNVFGEAYIMPAIATFENIRKCLGAASVTLPDDADLQAVPSTQVSSVVNHSVESNAPPNVQQVEASVTLESTKRMHALLHRPKVWDPRRWKGPPHDQSFLEIRRRVGSAMDVLDAFLSYTEPLDTRVNVEQERKLLEDATQKYTPSKSKVYLKDRCIGSGKVRSMWLTASALRAHLKAHLKATMGQDRRQRLM